MPSPPPTTSSSTRSSTSTLSVSILPKDFLTTTNRVLKLTPLPSYPVHCSLFIAHCDDNDTVKLVEIMRFERRVGSWMIREGDGEFIVGGDGNMMMVTEVDVKYVLLGMLEKVRRDVWQPTSEMVDVSEDGMRLLKRMWNEEDFGLFCEGKNVGGAENGLKVWKVCERLVLKWLLERLEVVVDVGGMGRNDAVELMRRYLGKEWGNLLCEKVVGVKGERENPGEDLAYEAMMDDMRPKITNGDENVNKANTKQPPAKKRRSATQAKLDKVDKTGIRSVASFFQKKS